MNVLLMFVFSDKTGLCRTQCEKKKHTRSTTGSLDSMEVSWTLNFIGECTKINKNMLSHTNIISTTQNLKLDKQLPNVSRSKKIVQHTT